MPFVFIMVMHFEKGNGGSPISFSTTYMNQMEFKFLVGIPGVTIPKRGFGDNELMLS